MRVCVCVWKLKVVLDFRVLLIWLTRINVSLRYTSVCCCACCVWVQVLLGDGKDSGSTILVRKCPNVSRVVTNSPEHKEVQYWDIKLMKSSDFELKQCLSHSNSLLIDHWSIEALTPVCIDQWSRMRAEAVWVQRHSWLSLSLVWSRWNVEPTVGSVFLQEEEDVWCDVNTDEIVLLTATVPENSLLRMCPVLTRVDWWL